MQTLRAAIVTQVVKPQRTEVKREFTGQTNTESDADTGQRMQSGLELDYKGKLTGQKHLIIEGLELDWCRMQPNWTKPVYKLRLLLRFCRILCVHVCPCFMAYSAI